VFKKQALHYNVVVVCLQRIEAAVFRTAWALFALCVMR